jgi:hypothetical protein
MDPKRYVVITVDYEIFGNGTGDVRQHVTEPAERMARVCEEYQAPLTVFFEAEEYAAFRRYSKNLRKNLGYDPARLMRDQAVDLCRRGHDLQLHLHPQWHGALYQDRQWVLHHERLTVDALFGSQSETDAYVASRKAIIDELARDSEGENLAAVYRAGGFAAQPGAKLLPALAANGFESKRTLLVWMMVVRFMKSPLVRYSGVGSLNSHCGD